jgi:uncharacterized protein (DUF427 family)
MPPPRDPVGPGQESVWDYPRPPRCEPTDNHITVVFNGVTVADTRRAVRVLETSHPPVYYLPPDDVRMDLLEPAGGGSFCEYKGVAEYYTLRVGDRVAGTVAWTYADPSPAFRLLAHHIAFYAAPLDGCYVAGEKVTPQPGGFYGGWVTPGVVGPFKGGPGSRGW